MEKNATSNIADEENNDQHVSLQGGNMYIEGSNPVIALHLKLYQ